MSKILLMREASEGEDLYKKILSSAGTVSAIPVLSFEYINQEKLRNNLTDMEKWNGIIFTSKRAVESVKNTFHLYPSNWSSIPCYTVGEATKRAAEQLGFKCKGEKSGTGKYLANYIVNDSELFDKDKLLLFICGVLKRDELPKALENENIPLLQVTTYRTVADQETASKIEEYVNCNGIPTYLVFFSPSGVNFSLDLWKEKWQVHSNPPKIISIGPTTTKALDNKGIHDVLTARFPNPESILEVINKDMV